MATPLGLESAARRRVDAASDQITHSLSQVAKGNPLGAEWQGDRLACRLRRKAFLSRDEAEAIARGIEAASRATAAPAKPGGPEQIWGSTIDFVGVAFLDRGRAAARAVARVAFADGRPQGSGFMVSDRLFLTNNHVISAAAACADFVLEFDYELDAQNHMRGPVRVMLDPATFFLTDARDDLDYTLVAVHPGNGRLSGYGFCPLSDSATKHALGEVANIVQHPDGRYKEVVLRENRLVSRLSTVLHYVADTEPGSSGSPVFNNEWQVVALHHWGGPWRQKADDKGVPVPKEVNEGIRISAIVGQLRARRSTLGAPQRELLDRMIALGESLAPPPAADAKSARGADTSSKVNPDGSVTWQIPLEISVRLPMLEPAADAAATQPAAAQAPAPAADGVEEKIKPDTNYSNRSGYKPRFIQGFDVPLPALSTSMRKAAARNREAEPGDDPFELRYHHFSIVMNKNRRLAFFTACNIDGSKAKNVDRDKGTVTVLQPDDPHLESLDDEAGAESTETWYHDERLLEGDDTDQSLYDQQKVAGFPVGNDPRRIARMMQRGHLVRRMDPAWGTDNQALKADADTFHFTNCTPQVGFFNMGTAKSLNLPNSGRGRLWRALENHVLRNAVTDDLRVSCFTGPVLDDADDLPWRGIKVPREFWKIVVWSQDGMLHSLAMIADQGVVIDAVGNLPEAASDAEAMDEIDKVEDFVTTIAEIERKTGLDFGEDVRNADIRKGEQAHRRVNTLDDVALTRPAKGKGRKKTTSAAKKTAKKRRAAAALHARPVGSAAARYNNPPRHR